MKENRGGVACGNSHMQGMHMLCSAYCTHFLKRKRIVTSTIEHHPYSPHSYSNLHLFVDGTVHRQNFRVHKPFLRVFTGLAPQYCLKDGLDPTCFRTMHTHGTEHSFRPAKRAHADCRASRIPHIHVCIAFASRSILCCIWCHSLNSECI